MVTSERETDLAWAAGFFEGEGCFSQSWQRSGKIQPRASLVQNERGLVERFQSVLGFGTIHHKQGPKRDYWEWSTRSSQDVRRVVAMLGHQLSDRRIHRAVGLLEQVDSERRLPTYSSLYADAHGYRPGHKWVTKENA